ncbi:hypothetical protein RO3G_11647 [Lichtheimia corymbifera JMRC:FSU:9682]|uniref:Uncharacterized protein n=1 Tax=Lichtheimia corymbifera JMRC:FSU:9682 TaxID=1263082 RepID=A0A068RNK5_9FUNG|nr:hypothetical protein RO3G_11647 [Lichtheimia corymbifera JMRC:FSU:9682]
MYQDSRYNYELPSIYKAGPVEERDSFDIQPSATQNQGLIDHDPQGYPSPPSSDNPSNVNDRHLAWLLLLTPLSMLIFTVIPAVASFPYVDTMTTGDAIFRLIDPIITLPLNLFIMFYAVPLRDWSSRHAQERTLVWILWAVGAGIYVQGHGVHLSAAMFKHPVQDFINSHPALMAANPEVADELQAIYSYMRNFWEHIIAHYMYAFGAVWMSWVQIFVFRNQLHGPLKTGDQIVFAIAALIYGLLVAGVAIDFPYGTYVGLPYTILLGIVCTLLLTLNPQGLSKGGILTMGRRMVLQYYLGASVVGLIVIIGWVGKYGFNNRTAAGI